MLLEKALLYLLIIVLRRVCIYSASPVIYDYVLLPSKIQILTVLKCHGGPLIEWAT